MTHPRCLSTLSSSGRPAVSTPVLSRALALFSTRQQYWVTCSPKKEEFSLLTNKEEFKCLKNRLYNTAMYQLNISPEYYQHGMIIPR